MESKQFKLENANLTFQQIANRAKTSRTVLYRRWPTAFELIKEINEYRSKLALNGDLIDKIQDTGSLIGDLLQFLTLYQMIYDEIGSEIMNAFLLEIGQNNKKIDAIKLLAIEKDILIMKKLLNFAKGRGEKIKEVSDDTLILPFDLIRMENIFHENEVDERNLIRLVDEILLPVFKY